jgi:hypothetical protein
LVEPATAVSVSESRECLAERTQKEAKLDTAPFGYYLHIWPQVYEDVVKIVLYLISPLRLYRNITLKEPGMDISAIASERSTCLIVSEALGLPGLLRIFIENREFAN